MKSMNLLKAAAVLLGLGGVVPAASAQMMAGPPPAVMPADYEFVVKAAYGGWGEIAAAQIALQNSGNPSVHQIANMMIADHTAANQELAGLAASRGIAAPTIPDSARQGTVAVLRQMSGPAFDSAYLMQQIADHRVGITLYETAASSSPDPALRAFAQRQLPVLHRHLDMVSGAARVASAR
jgi:putative membrane protein